MSEHKEKSNKISESSSSSSGSEERILIECIKFSTSRRRKSGSLHTESRTSFKQTTFTFKSSNKKLESGRKETLLDQSHRSERKPLKIKSKNTASCFLNNEKFEKQIDNEDNFLCLKNNFFDESSMIGKNHSCSSEKEVRDMRLDLMDKIDEENKILEERIVRVVMS